MKVQSLLKILVILGLDFCLFVYITDGYILPLLLLAAMILVTLIGEYVEIWQTEGIRLDKCHYEIRQKMSAVNEIISERTSIPTNKFIFYVIPTDEINAYSYGNRRIGVTSGLLQNFDDETVAAVLCHEIDHTINMDVVFKRIITNNVFLILFALSAAGIVLIICLWIIFGVLAFFRIGGGYFSGMLTKLLTEFVKKGILYIQNIVYFIYAAVIGVISRSMEYRADSFVVSLGLGNELRYFLDLISRLEPHPERRSISEILHDTHPPVYKRIAAIEHCEETSLYINN